MAMIFPGMDPYLEDPLLWPGVHASLIVYIRNQLQPLLRPRYIASIEQREFVVGPEDRTVVPDLWVERQCSTKEKRAVAGVERVTPVIVRVPALDIRETYVEILDRQSGQRVVTILEVVSPANKYAGPGRDSYVAKQWEVRQSQAHLVEIDLLRTGPHVLAVPEYVARAQVDYDYQVCVNRARGLREEFELYLCPLWQRLPRIHVPLAGDDPDVAVDLQAILAQAYDAGAYAERLNYDAPCRPPLAAEDQAWANERIAAARQQNS